MVVVFAFVACDEDFTEVGGEIINNPSNVELRELEVNTYSQKINSVQTNNLDDYFLGVSNHPVYGESVASIVTQLSLSSPDPDFGDNVELDSVVMTIPYYSTEVESATSGETEFKLDSVYGGGSFKLSVYETSYFLNDLDPDAGFEQRQKYYSNQQDEIENNIIGEPLYVNDNFMASRNSYVTYEVGEAGENDTIVKDPALRIKLPVDYFSEKIIAKEGADVLSNNNNFHNYLRSLLLKAESNGTDGSQILFNMASSDAEITLYYRRDIVNSEGDEENRRGSYSLNFAAGNRVNTYRGEFPENILQGIESQNMETGSENIYLKGQEGSMAVVELFPDQEVLNNLKEEELLINEAEIRFYVNENFDAGNLQPNRLYLYDLKNNIYLSDYILDPTVSVGNPELSLTNFSQPLKIAEDENGSYYALRITNHVSDIINEGAENVKLGLVALSNINSPVSISQGQIRGHKMSATRGVSDLINQISSGTLLSPSGVVLHGNQSGDEEKRLKLRIYYTNFN